MNNSDDMAFCPKCGKILVAYNNKYRCPRCKLEFKKSSVIKDNDNTSLLQFNEKQKIQSKKAKSSNIENKLINKVITSSERQLNSQELTWKSFFPYLNIRPQQKKIIETIVNHNKKKHIVVEAANGVGKTISSLVALLPIAKKKNKTIVYCCRTHEQMDRVTNELKLIRQLIEVSGISLRGRQELCLNPLVEKFAVDAKNASDICMHLKKEGKCSYFNNLTNSKLITKVLAQLNNRVVDTLDIIDIAESYELCPYELSKKILAKVDVVATSYQYMFNPSIRENFLLSLDKTMDDIVIVIDEAHNLPNVAIDISSDTLSAATIDKALSEAVKYKQGYLYDMLEAFQTVLQRYTADLRTDEDLVYDVDAYIKEVEKRARFTLTERVIEAIEELGELVKSDKMKNNKTPLSASSTVARFMHLLLSRKNKIEFAHFMSVSESRSGMKTPKMMILSLDPRFVTKEVFDRVYLSVSTSGTLEPISAYLSLVGLKESEVSVLSLPSPYESENILALVIQDVSTKMNFRNEQNYKTMNEVIFSVIDATPKNVGIFCASYSVLESLIDNGIEQKISKPLFIAYRGMSSRDNDRLITEFKQEAKRSGGVLLSVLGGRSSEGSDYPAELMQSVIIVGIPFARPNKKIDAAISYLDSQFEGKGREYGYNIPAMRTAAQAAGRPIRGLDDFAAIIFLDYRFGIGYYKKHLPNWLANSMRTVSPVPNNIKELIKRFFDYHLK